MNDNILFENENLKDYEKVTLFFTDCSYAVPISRVADLHFCTHYDKRRGKIIVSEGYIELSPSALAIGEKPIDFDDYEHDEERIERDLLSRLTEGADIYRIEFFSEEKELTIYLPCKPLFDCEERIIERSNCPSVKRLKNGNLRISAGNSSESVTRKPITYGEVCANWQSLMGKKYNPDILEGELLTLFVDEKEIAVELEIYNKRCTQSFAVFTFGGYKIHSFKLYTQQLLCDDLIIERMANGNIYVILRNCGICLECKEMNVYTSD